MESPFGVWKRDGDKSRTVLMNQLVIHVPVLNKNESDCLVFQKRNKKRRMARATISIIHSQRVNGASLFRSCMNERMPQRTAASVRLARTARGKKRKIPLKRDFFSQLSRFTKKN